MSAGMRKMENDKTLNPKKRKSPSKEVLKSKIIDFDQRATEAENRAEQAEHRMKEAEHRMKEAEHRMKEAEQRTAEAEKKAENAEKMLDVVKNHAKNALHNYMAATGDPDALAHYVRRGDKKRLREFLNKTLGGIARLHRAIEDIDDAEKIKKGPECPVCFSVACSENSFFSLQCGHLLCRKCRFRMNDTSISCPKCRRISNDDRFLFF